MCKNYRRVLASRQWREKFKLWSIIVENNKMELYASLDEISRIGFKVWDCTEIINRLSVFGIVFMAESIFFFCYCMFITR